MAKPPKIELPAKLDQPHVPADAATVQDLQAQIEQVRQDAIKALDSKEGDHASRMAVAQWYQGAIAAMEARQGELVANGEAEQAELDAIRESLSPKGADTSTEAAPDPADGSGAGDDDKDDDDKDDETETGGTTVTSGGVEAPAGNEAGVLVASGGVRRSAIRGAARGGTKPKVDERRQREAGYLTAAAETGFQVGQKIGWSELGQAGSHVFGKFPSQPGGAHSQQLIGRVNTPGDPSLVASAARGGDLIDLDEAIEWALSSERLKRDTGFDSLVAAGGWCAPSEVLYDLIDLISTDGLLDVPGITVNRGGVRYSLGPDFTAVFNDGANFTRTETQTIAGVAKPIVNIPCPSFTDNRMVVDGLYLTGDILSSKGYPEAYADFMKKSLAAFAHYVNMQSIADMVTQSGSAIDLTVSNSGVQQPNNAISTELLGAVELQVTDMRYKNRLSLTEAVDLIFPLWLKGPLRSDIAKRQGVEDAWKISDADIDEFFLLRGARAQWVYDWQDAFSGVSGGLGSSSAAVAWPTTALFLIHPQGGFVRALSDVIELNAVYDSTLLTTNQYVALFMEQARLTLKRAWDCRLVKVPVAVTGATGAAIDYTAAGKQPTV